MNKRILPFAILSTLLMGLPVRGNICITDSSGATGSTSAILPSFIGGPEGARTKFIFQLNCDTMVVPAGETTTIATNTFLHFPERELSNRIILVQGTLNILGTAKHSIILAGSKTVSKLESTIPGPEKWGGIRVAGTGALTIAHAALLNADTVLNLHSSRFRMDSTYFSGCNVYVLSDGAARKLGDGQYQSISNMESPLSAVAPHPPKPLEPVKPARADNSNANFWLWTGGIIGTAVVGGVSYFVLRDDAGGPNEPGNMVDPRPGLPTDQKPR